MWRRKKGRVIFSIIIWPFANFSVIQFPYSNEAVHEHSFLKYACRYKTANFVHHFNHRVLFNPISNLKKKKKKKKNCSVTLAFSPKIVKRCICNVRMLLKSGWPSTLLHTSAATYSSYPSVYTKNFYIFPAIHTIRVSKNYPPMRNCRHPTRFLVVKTDTMHPVDSSMQRKMQ